MPALSPTMEEGTLAKWLVKEGDKVKSGDILAEIETDKATMEFEAVDEGTIAKILVPEGTDGVKVGTVDRDDGRRGRGGERCRADAAERDAAGRRSRPLERGRARSQQAEGDADAASRWKPPRATWSPMSPTTRDAPEVPDGTAMVSTDRARGAARRDGRGNARRRARVRDGRGGRRISGRLQGHAGPARRVRAASA